MKNFTYDEVSDYIQYIQSLHPVKPFREANNHCIILRQDIDLDIIPSLRFMEIQRKLNITSTFFVLTTSPYYNIFSQQVKKALRQMVDNGMEIGLHFDPSLYENYYSFWADQEKEMLEYVIGDSVKSISFHNPSLHGKYPEIKNMINAYDPRFFSDVQYLSDSMREIPGKDAFRGKDPYQFIKDAKKFPLQVCLHPEQYFEDADPYLRTMMRLIERQSHDIYDNHRRTVDAFKH